MARIAPDSHVTLHYRLALFDAGAEREVANTFDAAPATLQMGVGQWAPTLERHLVGLDEGQTFEITLEPDAAYGPRNPELVHAVPRARVRAQGANKCKNRADEAELAPGDAVELESVGPMPLRGILKCWRDDLALVDFNHPLAGRALHLRVRVIGVF